MLKVHAFLVKLPELSDEAFFAHWRHPHGTMTRRIPQFRRYVQNHGLGNPPAVPGFACGPWLGMPVIWVDDFEALAAANAHPNYPELDADADEMYVRSALAWSMGREIVLTPQAAGAATMPVKALLLLKAGPTAIDEPALRSLLARLRDLLPEETGLRATLPGSAEAAGPFDAIVEISFDDRARFDAAWGDGAAIATEVNRIADPDATKAMLAREERVIWPDDATGGDQA